MSVKLTDEQQKFVNWASMGANVLVDACIGSGKTTSIQALCDAVGSKRNILYLTYNRLLKIDAKHKINDYGCYVTNYHGFAFMELRRYGVECGYSDILTVYNRIKPPTMKYDLLILDEYQDIDQDIADMLLHVKACNPGIQIVAVGDMDQKIYDRTRLRVDEFIVDFLGENYKPMEFTRCFRLNDDWASQLGYVWQKQIVGVNDQCEVLILSPEQTFDLVSKCEPKQLLVLGQKGGQMAVLQNRLEEEVSSVFNKYTVWSKIQEQDGGVTNPTASSAVFTTYDGSKGMERDICVLFDFTKQYWQSRMYHDATKYQVIRNVFCVAASRGKQKIILVDDGKHDLLTFDEIADKDKYKSSVKSRFNISDMFDYKYTEDVEDCYHLLDVQQVEAPSYEIDAPMYDGLIDLSPCIGNYQEASYFDDYNLDNAIQHCRRMNQGSLIVNHNTSGWSLFGKVLYLTSLETNQARYVSQVSWDFIPDWVRTEIHSRLAENFSHQELVQQECNITTVGKQYGALTMNGVCDVLKNNVVYELKFVMSLSHIHFLQCACYMLAMDLREGVLFNVRTGEKWKITIPDRKLFLNAVVRTVTKGHATGIETEAETTLVQAFLSRHMGDGRDFMQLLQKQVMTPVMMEAFFWKRGLVLPVPATHFARYVQRKAPKVTRIHFYTG